MICNCHSHLKLTNIIPSDNEDDNIFLRSYLCYSCNQYRFDCPYCHSLIDKWRSADEIYHCKKCDIDFQIGSNKMLSSLIFNYKNIRSHYELINGKTHLIIGNNVLKLKDNIFKNKNKEDIVNHMKSLLIYL